MFKYSNLHILKRWCLNKKSFYMRAVRPTDGYHEISQIDLEVLNNVCPTCSKRNINQ